MADVICTVSRKMLKRNHLRRGQTLCYCLVVSSFPVYMAPSISLKNKWTKKTCLPRHQFQNAHQTTQKKKKGKISQNLVFYRFINSMQKISELSHKFAIIIAYVWFNQKLHWLVAKWKSFNLFVKEILHHLI